MESHFRHDFSTVRVHDAPPETAAALQARSWTVGRDIFTTPAVRRDPRVLAHELAHVVQQRGTSADEAPPVGARGSPQERMAARAADAVARGEPVPDPGRAPASVQRDEPTAAPAATPAPAAAPAAPVAEGPAPPPAAESKPHEPEDLASVELTLTPMNFELPKGPHFFNPGFSIGIPFKILERGKWELELGPSIGVDFHFGESDVLPKTSGYTGWTLQGSVEVEATYNFANGHKVSLSLGGGGGATDFSDPRLSGRSAGFEGAFKYTYEPRKGLEFFGGIRGALDWEWAQTHSGAERGGSAGLFAGFTLGFPVLKKRPKAPAKVTAKPVVQQAPAAQKTPAPAPAPPKTYSAADVPRSRVPVDPAEEAQFAQLRDYIMKAASEIRAAAASPPKHKAWMKDNPNIDGVVTLVNDLAVDLDVGLLIIRFDQPAGKQYAEYEPATNVMHVQPLAGASMAVLAGNVIHEYVHVHQDRAIQKTLSTAHAPLEQTPEDELQDEIAAYVTENYFLELIQSTSLKEVFDWTQMNEISQFRLAAEKVRSGRKRKVKQGKKELRGLVEGEKKSQMEANAPRRTYRLEIDAANHARLVTGAATFVDLGVIPMVEGRVELRRKIIETVRTHVGTELRQLFDSGYKFVILRVYQDARELEELELAPGDV